jgi:short-subunit dehydrogenase
VQVSVLCPGPVRTAFQRKAGIGGTVPMHGGVMTASEVARVGYEAFKRGQITVIPGWRNRVLALLVRVAPRRLVPAVVRRLQEARRG